MAVTQQLVRIPDAQADTLRRSRAALDALTSFRLAPPTEHLDLDWAASGLRRLARAMPLEAGKALQQILQGTTVAASLRQDIDVYSDVRLLSAADVKQAWLQLAGVEVAQVVDALPDDLAKARRFLGTSEIPDNPKEYFRRSLEGLFEFVREAAARDLAILTWSQ